MISRSVNLTKMLEWIMSNSTIFMLIQLHIFLNPILPHNPIQFYYISQSKHNAKNKNGAYKST